MTKLSIKITKEQKYVDGVAGETCYQLEIHKRDGTASDQEYRYVNGYFTLEEMQQIRDELIKKIQ